MRVNRVLTSSLKLLVLALASWGLYVLWHTHAANTIVVPDDDDIVVTPRVSVQVGTIARKTLRRYIGAYGIVECEPARDGRGAALASVTVPTASMVVDVNCAEGQHVEKGAVLFSLDGRAAEAAVNLATKQLDAANEAVSRIQASSKENSLRPIDLLRAEHERDLAKIRLDDAIAQRNLLKVVAPLSGTIVQLSIHPGEVAGTGKPVVDIADLDRLTVAVSVPTSELASIKVGQRAEIILPSDSSVKQTASPRSATTRSTTTQSVLTTNVSFIDPVIDSQSNMGSVDIAVPVGTGLRLGQLVSSRIVAEEHADCLAVPVESVANDAQGNPSISLIVRDFRWAVRQPVEVGIREGNLVEIRGTGLKGGEDIVTVGAYALKDRSMIEVIR